MWGYVYSAQPGPLTVVSIRQAYAGHAKQTLLVAAGARAGAYGGKFYVVVDDESRAERVARAPEPKGQGAPVISGEVGPGRRPDAPARCMR